MVSSGLLFWTIALFWITDGDASKAEERLLKDLFTNYTKQARPALNDSDTVNVTLGMTLNQIIDVVEKTQTLVISVWTRQKWKNAILHWDPAKYNNIQSINISPKDVWLPDIVLYNNADEDKSFGGNLDRLNTRIKLNYTGETTWLAPVILRSKCPINVQYFPFDEQRCQLKFGSWTYDKDRLDIHSETGDVGATLEKYSDNSEWRLEGVPAKKSSIRYKCCPEEYPDITYTVIVKRRSLFFLCNLIFPMTMIGMLTMLSFLLPAESGERVSLAITLLLAMTVFMLVVADIIPPTSENIPLVGIFFSSAMVEMVIMIVVLCYVMKLYHKEPGDPPMSWWMRKYILNYLSYKLGIRHKEDNDQSTTPDNYMQMMSFLRRASSSDVSVRDDESKDTWGRSTTQRLINGQAGKDPITHKSEPPQCVHRASKKNNEAEMITRRLDVIVEKIKGDEEDDKTKCEWRIVAMTIDKLLLATFIFVLLITVFGCFLNAPGYVS